MDRFCFGIADGASVAACGRVLALPGCQVFGAIFAPCLGTWPAVGETTPGERREGKRGHWPRDSGLGRSRQDGDRSRDRAAAETKTRDRDGANEGEPGRGDRTKSLRVKQHQGRRLPDCWNGSLGAMVTVGVQRIEVEPGAKSRRVSQKESREECS